MTGPGHYAEAERLVREAGWPDEAGVRHFDGDSETEATLAAAQVHATLALAATQATSLINTPDVIASEVIDAWQRATS